MNQSLEDVSKLAGPYSDALLVELRKADPATLTLIANNLSKVIDLGVEQEHTPALARNVIEEPNGELAFALSERNNDDTIQDLIFKRGYSVPTPTP